MIPVIGIILLQVINVNASSPCWMNVTAGIDMLQNCGFGKDWLSASIAPWIWITGGWVSMIIASILILMSYMKYKKAIYPIGIGVSFLPISYFLFPAQFISFAVIIGFVGIGLIIAWAIVSQTNET